MLPEYTPPLPFYEGGDVCLTLEVYEGVPLIHCHLRHKRKGMRELDSIWPWFIESTSHIRPICSASHLLDVKRQKFAERMGFRFLTMHAGHTVHYLP